MIENPAENTVARDQLRSYVERLERLDEEIKERNDDKSDVLKEAKSGGFCTKTIRKIVALRRQDPAAVQEQDALLDMYKSAMGMLD